MMPILGEQERKRGGDPIPSRLDLRYVQQLRRWQQRPQEKVYENIKSSSVRQMLDANNCSTLRYKSYQFRLANLSHNVICIQRE